MLHLKVYQVFHMDQTETVQVCLKNERVKIYN